MRIPMQLVKHIYTLSGQGKQRFIDFAGSPMPQSSSRCRIDSLPCGFIISLQEMQEPFTSL
ncbi:hypothetical protein PDENDC454_12875 [Paenibacillus dendritiformis C454]|uniref:Uncharacterized protein n=1 Tax=Paenibacillus dendritiformis C454 TaxID=1131935 RepID=H3SGC0_9BACL|nr:hypothetical protein PDENDC454_12875 [Paenibacillus dendritiformis C454]